MNSRPFTFDRVIRMLIGIAVLVIVFLLVKRLSGVLLPFIIAWLLAYLLQPIVHFFQFKLKFKSRILSIATVLTLFISLITGIVLMLIPIVTDELQKAAKLLVNYSQSVNINDYIPSSWQSSLQYYFSHLNIQKALRDPNIMDAVKKIAPQIWDLFNSSIDFVLGIAVVMVIFLYLVFILLDFEKISSGMFSIIPPKYQKLAGESNGSLRRIIQGNTNILRSFRKNGYDINGFYLVRRLTPKVWDLMKTKILSVMKGNK
jgi:predicted PurR-regulated permease PerM